MTDLRGPILILGALVLVGAQVAAQQPQGPSADRFGPEVILDDSMVKELKLDKEQTEKAKRAVERVVRKQHPEIKEAIRPKRADAASAREQFHMAMKRTIALREDASKALAEVLTPEQHKQFEQLSLQRLGVMGMTLPRVERQLKLSDDQKKQVEKIHDDMIEEVQKIVREGFRQANGDLNQAARTTDEKIQSLHNSALDKATALLSDEQKRIWSDLSGYRP